MTTPDFALRHYLRRAGLTRTVADALAELWRGVDPSDISRSWLERLPEAVTALTAGQLAAAQQAEAYADAAAAAEGLSGAAEGLLAAAAFAGVAADGRGLLTLLAQPVFTALSALKAGKPVGVAMDSAADQLDRIARTEVADAGRAADQVAIAARPQLEGYIRVLVGETCARCIILAGRWYPYSEGFRRHDLCDCVHLSASQARAEDLIQDPHEIYDGMTPAQRLEAGWSQEDQDAIALGADLFQVTNAKRSTYIAGSLEFTRDGTTVRGLFGGYYIEPETGHLRRRANDELTKRPGQRVRSARERRLTPNQIMTSARDREHAIQMLRRYGYLLGEPTPEKDPDPVPVPEPEIVEIETEVGSFDWLNEDGEDDDWAAILEAAANADPGDIRDRLIRQEAAEPRPTVDIGQMVAEPFKVVTKKRRAEIDRLAHQLFDGTYAGIEARVTETDIDEFSSMTVVKGELFDGAGAKVGHFLRGYNYVGHVHDDGRDLVARHETLEITDRALHGQGFAEEFNSHLEASYRASGVDRITLTASLNIGGYTWARAGYDFATEWTAANIATSLRRLVLNYEAHPGTYGGRDIGATISKARALLARMDSEPFGSTGFPSPYEISQLGRWDGAGRDDLWLGKESLLGRTWEGVKPL